MEQFSAKKRVGLIDDLRGFFIIFVVIYHGLYDLVSIFGVDLSFFGTGLMDGLRIFGASMFMVISGVACRFSRNNLKRGVQTLAFAMVLTIGTMVFMPSQQILFGILHFMGTAMILFALTHKLIDKLPVWVGVVFSILCFVLFYSIGLGYIGINGLFRIHVPAALFETNFLFPLGFYSRYFFSSDYYPLLPWFFMFLLGTYFGVPIREGKAPAFVYRSYSKTLSFIGRHTIIIYLVHQPIIYGVLTLWFTLMK